MRGGMQSSQPKAMCCRCGLETSKILVFTDKEISIHFGRKSTYWHIYENGKTRRVFKKPNEWI